MTRRLSIAFFFCTSCPWTYLAFVRLKETALRTGTSIDYRPVLAGLTRPAIGRGSLASRNEAVASYVAKDLQDWARFCGVTITVPRPLPVPPEWAQRGIVAALEANRGEQYIEALFRAHFEHGRDISQFPAVLDVASECGIARTAFEARLSAADLMETVRSNSEELVSRGGFATPTLFMDNDMYFGHDRMSLVEFAIMRSDERPFIAPGEHGR